MEFKPSQKAINNMGLGSRAMLNLEIDRYIQRTLSCGYGCKLRDTKNKGNKTKNRSMNEKTIYSGTYRNVFYIIRKFEAFDFDKEEGREFSWTHYIYLHLDKQIPDKELADKFWLTPRYDDKGRTHYDYYDSIIYELEFHGGCTWYSKESSVDDKHRRVKIGCDYQHLWDQGFNYSLEYVEDECHKTIDSLLRITKVNKHCGGCGSWTLPETFVAGYCNDCTWAAQLKKDKQ